MYVLAEGKNNYLCGSAAALGSAWSTYCNICYKYNSENKDWGVDALNVI